MPDHQASTHKDPGTISIPRFMPFFWLATALVSGILIADLLKLHWAVWAVTLGLCLLLWLLSRTFTQYFPNSRRLPLIVLAVIFLMGALRYQVAQPKIDPTHSAYYNDRGSVEIVGVVSGPPETRDSYTGLNITVESLTILSSDASLAEPKTIHGQLLLQVMPGSAYAYGDRLSIRGQLQTPPDSGDFSYQKYLARQGIHSLMQYASLRVLERETGNPVLAAIYRVKARSQVVLQQIMPSPESDLLRGILLGDESGLSPQLKAAYKLTGTSHIIAISGFNIAILAGLITTLFNRALGARWGTLAAIGVISLYTLLVGADAAVVRAAVMGSFGMLGVLIGRRGNGLNTLGLAAFLMCLLEPNLPWDIGFQLSFFATLGLVIYASPLQARLLDFLGRHMKEESAKRLSGMLSEYLLFTLVAQVLVLPIMAWHFGTLSWLYLVANPLILPAQPPVMIFGGLALLGGLVHPVLGRILAWLAWPFAAYTNQVVEWLAKIVPQSMSMGFFSFLWVVLYYLLFFILTLSKDRKAFFKGLYQPATLLLTLGCTSLIIWSFSLSSPDGKLSLTLLPGSNNPVVLIESPGGRFVLINGAGRVSALNEALGEALPFGRRQVDVLVIPSCRRDDVIGLTGLAGRVQIGQALWVCDPETIQTTRMLYQGLKSAGVPQRMLEEGAWLDLGEGAVLRLVGGYQKTSAFNLEWQHFSAQLAFGKVEQLSGDAQSTPSLLVLPGDTNPEKLDGIGAASLHPNLVLLPVDAQSLPLDGELHLLSLLDGVQTLRTDQAGWLSVRTDGTRMWLLAEHQP